MCPGGKRVLLLVGLLSRIDHSDRSAPGPTTNFQTQAHGRGYLEAECAKDPREDGCLETNLWPTFEQVHEGRSTRSATKKESLVTPCRGGSPMREGPNKCRGDVVTVFPPQRAYATMPWMPPASNATNLVWEHEGVWMQCFPMSYPLHYHGEGSRTLVHDRLGLRQSRKH